jgi:GTP-binding protein
VQRDDYQDQIDDATETFYSPNVEIDDSRYRYDLEDGDLHTSIDENDHDSQSSLSSSSVNEYSFFDEATIYVRAGSGGQGASTYKKGVGGQDGPPDGGNGGRGGDVVLVVDDSLNTLAGLTQGWRPNSFGGSGASYKNQDSMTVRPKSFRAETGCDGERRVRNGRWGQEVVIRVPPGTVVQEEIESKNEDGEVVSVTYVDMGTITMDEPQLIVALGGEGGEGSGVAGKFAGRGVRRPRIPPVRGERKKLKLTLKIVADVALVGVPNAGKSTFLASVTRAKPKIANVSFMVGFGGDILGLLLTRQTSIPSQL